ncbi:unnamed protein product [Vicia faba]|uniref:Uncharacterized protein n=1 Tax=Vicia faba TaxID=3906 RepID=A0AAV0ZK64_VICFA|nr:unnamed protein product [Vicia faba]
MVGNKASCPSAHISLSLLGCRSAPPPSPHVPFGTIIFRSSLLTQQPYNHAVRHGITILKTAGRHTHFYFFVFFLISSVCYEPIRYQIQQHSIVSHQHKIIQIDTLIFHNQFGDSNHISVSNYNH